MTAAGGDRRRSPLSEEELKVLARWIARTFLEVERGHRPPAALRRVASKLLFARLQYLQPTAGQPAVTYRDVGGATVSRPGSTTVFIVVTVSDTTAGWEALLIDLERAPTGRWQVTNLRRLRDAITLTRANPARHERTHRQGPEAKKAG